MSTPSVSPWLELRNVTDKSAELYIYGPVGDMEGASHALASLPALGSRDLIVRINSPGGSAFAGLSVYNTLNSYPGKVIVYIDGLAASIASVIAMAGDEIRIAKNAMLMIHRPSSSTAGGAEAFRTEAEMLEKLGDNLRDIYAARSGMKPADVEKRLETDSWLSADEAKALGLVTHVEAPKSATASFDLSNFKNVPEALRAPAKLNMTDNTSTAQAASSPAAANANAEDVTAKVDAAVAAAVAEANARAALEVTAKVREAVEAAHAAAKTQHLEAVNALKSEHSAETAKLTKRATEAEAMSAQKIGAPPVANASGNIHAGAKAPTGPAEILAHYRTLTGKARDEYFAQHKNTIWEASSAA